MAPFIFLTDSLYIPTYLLVISLTYILCTLWVFKKAQREKHDTSIALDICLMIMVGGFVGARLMHIFYENFDYYLLFPLDVFKIWQGGFVFYGGLIGAMLFSATYLYLRKENFWIWGDFFAPIIAFGYGLGRLGCFLNGCCFGRQCELPWAIEFNHPGLPEGLRHPTQLYATGWEFLITLPLLLWVIPRLKFPRPGYLFLAWVLLHSIGRLIMESYREDYRGHSLYGLSVSSWISLGLMAAALGVIALPMFRQRRS